MKIKSWIFGFLVILCISNLIACRRYGFYNPIYSEKQVEQLFQQRRPEFDQIAKLSDHMIAIHFDLIHEDGVTIEPTGIKSWQSEWSPINVKINSDGKVLLASTRESLSTTKVQQMIGLTEDELGKVFHLGKQLKIETISTMSAYGKHHFLEVSFAGGGAGPHKWPYGLIFIPENEPMNLLADVHGGPGPGFKTRQYRRSMVLL